eukprot:scaffold1431_cov346-Pavlova_lutheri.AAC.9
MEWKTASPKTAATICLNMMSGAQRMQGLDRQTKPVSTSRIRGLFFVGETDHICDCICSM